MRLVGACCSNGLGLTITRTVFIYEIHWKKTRWRNDTHGGGGGGGLLNQNDTTVEGFVEKLGDT